MNTSQAQEVLDNVQRFLTEEFHKIRQKLKDGDDVLIYGIACAVFVVILTTFIIYLFRRKRRLQNAVLITGLSEAGKTLLFSRLVSGKNVDTYTSMKENIAAVSVNKKKIKLIDIPGNERLRYKFLETHLPSSRGVVFVVDSMNFPKEIRDVADFLYSVLQERFVQKYSIPFLIVCNKQDHAVAKSAKVIQSQLEKEMNALRVTYSGKLDSTSPNDDNVFLGHRDREFKFADLKPLKIEFAECSALEPGEGEPTEILHEIWSWVSKIV